MGSLRNRKEYSSEFTFDEDKNKLLTWNTVPEYYRDNKFIRGHYRPQLNSVSAALKSFVQVHNESMNVWTHLLGAFIVVGMLIMYMINYSPHAFDYFVQPHHHEAPEIALYTSTDDSSSHPGLLERLHLPALNLPSTEEALAMKDRVLAQVSAAVQDKITYFASAVAYSRTLEEGAAERLYVLRDHILNELHLLVHGDLGHLTQTMDLTQHEMAAAVATVLRTLHNVTTRLIHTDSYLQELALHTELLIPQLERWPITVFMLSGALCLLFSATFHLLSAVNQKYQESFRSLDYAGILLLMAGSNLPIGYYAFYCFPVTQAIHATLSMLLGIGGFFLICSPILMNPERRFLRTWLFIAFGFYGIVPLAHLYLVLGWNDIIRDVAIMGGFYVGGALIYLFHIPERWLPGKLDVIGNSHQLWHIIVVIAICVHYVGITDFYHWRMHEACPATP